jgi:hypothetical protein
MDSATRLQAILVDSPIGVVLPLIALLNLPNWWLAAGAVRNTIWRSLFRNEGLDALVQAMLTGLITHLEAKQII